MHLAPDRLLSAVHIRAATSRGIHGFSRRISHSLLYHLSHGQSLFRQTHVISTPATCIPLHIKKMEPYRDTFIRTRVFIPVISFFKGAIWEGFNLLSVLTSLVQTIFSPYFFRSTHVEKLRNLGLGKGRRGGHHLL